MTGQVYEAKCGNCGIVLYGAPRGVYVRLVSCPRCKADNIFEYSTVQRDGDIVGHIADIDSGIAHTSQRASLSGQ